MRVIILKRLVYLKIKVKDRKDEFIELYTFTKPTIFYLPDSLILEVKDIDSSRIAIEITSTKDLRLCIRKVLSLCKKDFIKEKICICDNLIYIYLKLCEINELKPIYRDPCKDDCFDE